MDGALKLKEVAYLHAEEFPTGEILHGPLALVDGKVVAFVIATRDLTQPGSMQRYEKTISNMRTFKSRSGTVIALAHEGDETVRTVADEVVPISRAAELLLPILEIVPLQLFAYHLATLLGKEVDRPRSLSKAVITD